MALSTTGVNRVWLHKLGPLATERQSRTIDLLGSGMPTLNRGGKLRKQELPESSHCCAKKKYVRYQTMESNCDFDPDKLRSILFSLDCCLIYFNNGIQVVPVSNKILV